jgi:hypothetical protein
MDLSIRICDSEKVQILNGVISKLMFIFMSSIRCL